MVDEHLLAIFHQMKKRTPHSTQELLQLLKLCEQFIKENEDLKQKIYETDVVIQFKVIDDDPFWLAIGKGQLFAEVGEIYFRKDEIDIFLEGTLNDIAKFIVFCYDIEFIGE